MYGNRKDFPSSTTYWGPRLTQGEVRAIRPDDIQRELIKIANLDAVAIALLTGDVDKLDPNLHCKHVPMTKQGFTLLAASPTLVTFMTTCTEPDQLLSVLRDNSKKYRTQDEIDNAVRTAVDVYNTTLLLSVTSVSDQTNVNRHPEKIPRLGSFFKPGDVLPGPISFSGPRAGATSPFSAPITLGRFLIRALSARRIRGSDRKLRGP